MARYCVILLMAFGIATLSRCGQNNAAAPEPRSLQAIPANTKSDTIKYLKGPLLKDAACCKGAPSRARALAARK